jgi:eukaryotic-like serine/threonine-protein kinase
MTEGTASASASQEPADPMIGRVIASRFRVLGLMERGGMGRVYRAEQLPLGRVCALKVVHPGFAAIDPDFQKRFMLEASTVSKLAHPNTVTIFDYGKTEDDIYYMAMELLEGVTLHRAIREAWMHGGFEQERALRIAAQICRSLREAHGHGVVHRDLKPANIFLVSHGDEKDFVKVLDFGLVKQIADRPEEQLTQTGLFMGSPKYVAPEQIEGLPVDGRTDIYSLGVILFEMLTGRVPYDRPTSVATLMAHVHEPIPSLRHANPNVLVSVELDNLVRSCLGKLPEERFASMDALLDGMRGLSTSPSLNATSIQHLSAPVLDAISSARSVRSGDVQAEPTAPALPDRSAQPLVEAPSYGPSWLTVVSLLLLSAIFGGLSGYTLFRTLHPEAWLSP